MGGLESWWGEVRTEPILGVKRDPTSALRKDWANSVFEDLRKTGIKKSWVVTDRISDESISDEGEDLGENSGPGFCPLVYSTYRSKTTLGKEKKRKKQKIRGEKTLSSGRKRSDAEGQTFKYAIYHRHRDLGGGVRERRSGAAKKNRDETNVGKTKGIDSGTRKKTSLGSKDRD